jgi:hypothetical protein
MKKMKKLVLAKETLRRLEQAALREAAGGATIGCNTIACTTGCPTGPIACQSNPLSC